MSKLNKFVKIISKIGELISEVLLVIIGVGTMLFSLFGKGEKVYEVIGSISFSIGSQTFNLSCVKNVKEGLVIALVFTMFSILIYALIFRSIHRIFKTTENKTPFIKENVKTIRCIGYLIILEAFITCIKSLVLPMVFGVPIHGELELSKVFYGLVVLCLSQYFAHGLELEKEVEGLL